jgi:hypothetical protein
LILRWREPKMCPDRSRGSEATGIVDGRRERQRHESADTGRRHETPDAFVGTSNGQQPLLNGAEFQSQSCPGPEKRVGDDRQGSVVFDQLADAVLERLRCRRPNLYPNPRSTPRMLISTSWRLPCNSLRVVSSARTSWAGNDLQ